MCFRVLNWLERETDADIYRNFVSPLGCGHNAIADPVSRRAPSSARGVLSADILS